MELKSIAGSRCHPKAITCIAYHAARREIYTGSEDSVVRVWDTNTNESCAAHLAATHHQHTGWVTAMAYCKEIKCMATAAQDGDIVVWTQAGKISQRVHTKMPIYSLCWNSRRSQLMVGHNSCVQVYATREDSAIVSSNKNSIDQSVLDLAYMQIDSHKDIVSCLATCEASFYSAGYDGTIVFYESFPHSLNVFITRTILGAHTAGITCLSYARDAENFWLISGSFDRFVKLWSLNGHCLHQFAAFPDTITAAAYVPSIQSLWISCNSTFPIFYDPKSGVNVSDFVKADNEKILSRGVAKFKLLLYVPETGELIGTTSRRQLVVWRYNVLAPVTTLKSQTFDVLTMSRNDPILFFSGGPQLSLMQWERLHLNTFMYSREPIVVAMRSRRQSAVTSIVYHEPLDLLIAGVEDGSIIVLGYFAEQDAKYRAKTTVNSSGFFYSGIATAKELRRVVRENPVPGRRRNIIEEEETPRSAAKKANRVSGLCTKYKIYHHREAVTALVFIGKYHLVSTGWDRKIFISDLRNCGQLTDSFKDPNRPATAAELASDGPILDAACNINIEGFHPKFFETEEISAEYIEKSCLIAFASSDTLVYIRRVNFGQGDQLALCGVLKGHNAEVIQVKWYKTDKCYWVTGSEDRTIRIWDAQTLECTAIINNESSVTAMTVDDINHVFITGSRDRIIRVFDQNRLVQKHYGHTDEICAILHVPVRGEYISSSWDGTLRVWHAYVQPKVSPKQLEEIN